MQQLPLAKQVQVVVGGDAAKSVRVVELDRLSPFEVDKEAVVDAVLERRDAGNNGLEQAVGVNPRHCDGRLRGVPQPHFYGSSAGPEHPDDHAAVPAVDMGAEQPEGVAMLPASEGVQVTAERHGVILIDD